METPNPCLTPTVTLYLSPLLYSLTHSRGRGARSDQRSSAQGMHPARDPCSQSWVWGESHRPGIGSLSSCPCCDLTSPRPARRKGEQSPHTAARRWPHCPGQLSARGRVLCTVQHGSRELRVATEHLKPHSLFYFISGRLFHSS